MNVPGVGPQAGLALRMAAGLTALLVALLLVLDLVAEVLPDPVRDVQRIRLTSAENVRVMAELLLERGDREALKRTLGELRVRNGDVVSVGVRDAAGELVARSGEHERSWVPPLDSGTMVDHVRMPLHASGAIYDLEMAFRPITPRSARDWLGHPLVVLFGCLVPFALAAFYAFLRHAMRSGARSAAIPDRVRVAFDFLNEGVVIMDRHGRVMMANSAFRRMLPTTAGEHVGSTLSEHELLAEAVAAMSDGPPWQRAMNERRAIVSELMVLTAPSLPDERQTVVSCSPVEDDQGRARGCLVTFDDVTELHRANQQLIDALQELDASRTRIVEQNEELARLASRDPLTGCLNRRAFFEALEPLFAEGKVQERQIGCLMADIDHFKSINDRYGHAIGDQAIVAVARALSAGLRSNDLICRYGGEEFCVIMPDASEQVAYEVAERLRREVASRAGASLRTTQGLSITLSVGVATLARDVNDPELLIDRADWALYLSKKNGRNRVSIWSREKEAAA